MALRWFIHLLFLLEVYGYVCNLVLPMYVWVGGWGVSAESDTGNSDRTVADYGGTHPQLVTPNYTFIDKLQVGITEKRNNIER